MRPAGEVRRALLQACCELATPERGATLQEIARRACVGYQAARNTLPNLVRAKQLHTPRTRREAHRNRPVAEYAPYALAADLGAGGELGSIAELGAVLRSWGGEHTCRN